MLILSVTWLLYEKKGGHSLFFFFSRNFVYLVIFISVLVVSHVRPYIGILMIYSTLCNIGDTMGSEISEGYSICRSTPSHSLNPFRSYIFLSYFFQTSLQLLYAVH